MTCSAASTLQPQAAPSLLPLAPPTTPGAWQQVRSAFQQVLQMIQGAAGATGVNVIPQQYALLAGSTLPPISAVSNCAVAQDATKPLFGAGGSYKISITGSPATVTFSADTAWPLHPGWQWIASFFQQASAAISGAITITTPTKAYTTDFTTTLTAEGWERLFDTLNLGADTSATFGLSFTFTGGAGQTVWLDGLMMEPYFNVAMAPSPFISTSGPLTLDNNPDGSYSKILTTHTSGNVAFNYKGVWSGATAYVVGDEVVYGESYWLALAASTNSAPSPGNGNWQVVGSYSAFLGAWSNLTTYAVGAEVTYNGNFWIAVAQNSNSAPAIGNANWQIAGPQSLQYIADGANRFAVTNGAGLGGVSSYDGNNRALIDFSQGGHLNKIIDELADGTYGKVLSSGLSGSKLTAAGINNGAVSALSEYSAYTGADPFDTDPPTGWLEIGQNLSATLWSGTFSGAYTTIIRAKIGFYAGIAVLSGEAQLLIDGVEHDIVGAKIYGSPVPCVMYGQLEAYISDPAEGSHTISVVCYNKAGSNNYNYWFSMPFLSVLRLLN